MHLLGEVLLADLADQLELRLEPVDVLLLGDEDLLEQLAGAVVADLATQTAMPLLSRSTASYSSCEVALELLGHRLADAHRAEPLQVGDALEEQDALDELVGVLHLVDRLVADLAASRS